MATDKNNNPWKGLNFYVEGDIIYGRDVEILNLSHYIFNNTQTVLYGRSGIGKSSILNAGIFPQARERNMIPVVIRLKHDNSEEYLSQIRKAMNEAGIEIREILPPVSVSRESVWEFMHRHRFYSSVDKIEIVPLLVFDQFEEIFTLQSQESKIREFFSELADLFNDVKPLYVIENERIVISKRGESSKKSIETGAFKGLSLTLNLKKDSKKGEEPRQRYIDNPNYHIVFSLREDFLSSLETYAYNIPIMKNNRFPLRPINEQQAAEIITRPLPGLVTPDVAKLIIEKVTRTSVFSLDGVPTIQVDSAILSLYLSRLYEKMIAEGEISFSRKLVEAHSANIIEDFYSDSIEGLPETSVFWLEDTLINKEGRRDNRDRFTVLQESGLDESQLDRLIDDVKLLRQFSYGGDLRIEYIHDVLCDVIRSRRDKRAEQKRIREIEEKSRMERRKSRKRVMIIGFSALMILFVSLGVYGWNHYYNESPVEKYFASYELRNGWPVGVGPELSKTDRSNHPLYYKLSHKGHRESPFTDIEVCSSNSMLPQTARIVMPEFNENIGDTNGDKFNDILANTQQIRFEPAENGRISKMEFLGADRNPLLILNYFHSGLNEAWIQYLGPTGQTFNIRDNGIDRSKIVWDSIGRVVSQKFYTSTGTIFPINSDTKMTGFAWSYPDDETVQTDYLFEYVLPDNNLDYNRKIVRQTHDTIDISYWKALSDKDVSPTPGIGVDGYSRILKVKDKEYLYRPGERNPVAVCEEKKDSQGNIIQQRITGHPTSYYPPFIVWKYKGKTGLETEKRYMNSDGTPYGILSTDIYLWQKEYDDLGKLIKEKRISKDGETLYTFSLENIDDGKMSVNRQTYIDKIKGIGTVRIDSILNDGNYKSISFYDLNGTPVNNSLLFGNDTVQAHSVRLVTDGDSATERYYEAVDGLVKKMRTCTGSLGTSVAHIRKVTEKPDKTLIEIISDDSKIVKRMVYLKQNGQIVGRAAAGIIDDNPVRCPNWEEEGFGYYVIYYSKNFADQFTSVRPFDEWWNPSVLLIDDDYSIIDYPNFKNVMMVNDYPIAGNYYQPVLDVDKTVTSAEVPYLHILSPQSIFYNDASRRLHDGDRIVSFGNWRYGMPKSILESEWNKRLDGREINVKVLRPESDGLRTYRFVFKGNKDEASKSEIHVLKLSQSEKNFFDKYFTNDK